jgi:ParB family chromosome partitioning protein
LRDLLAETQDTKFGKIQCLIRTIDTDPDAYIAMVEENEIRANLSFYERARLASEAARLGLYWDAGAAVSALFARATPAKRSKIVSFVSVHTELGEALRFPTAIPERLGLALSGALQQDSRFAARLKDSLRKTPPQNALEERAQLERALRKQTPTKAPDRAEAAPGVFLEAKTGRVVLTGKGVDAKLRDALKDWLAAR